MFASLYGRRIPDKFGKRMDLSPGDPTPKPGNPIYRVEGINADLSLYAEYQFIEPNDVNYNRGAYIGAGFFTTTVLTPWEAREAIGHVEEIQADLKRFRDPDTSEFPPSFRLHSYNGPEPSAGSSSAHNLHADLLAQVLHDAGRRQPDNRHNPVRHVHSEAEIKAGKYDPLRRHTKSGALHDQGMIRRLAEEAGLDLLTNLWEASKRARKQAARSSQTSPASRYASESRRTASPILFGHQDLHLWKIGTAAMGIFAVVCLVAAIFFAVHSFSWKEKARTLQKDNAALEDENRELTKGEPGSGVNSS